MKTVRNTEKPRVANLGTCVVERDGEGFLVMFCDGSVRAFMDYAKAFTSISKHLAKNTPKDAIGICQIVSYDGSTSVKASRNGYVVEL